MAINRKKAVGRKDICGRITQMVQKKRFSLFDGERCAKDMKRLCRKRMGTEIFTQNTDELAVLPRIVWGITSLKKTDRFGEMVQPEIRLNDFLEIRFTRVCIQEKVL